MLLHLDLDLYTNILYIVQMYADFLNNVIRFLIKINQTAIFLLLVNICKLID